MNRGSGGDRSLGRGELDLSKVEGAVEGGVRPQSKPGRVGA